MNLVTPDFIHHEGRPIFSCDIHPDGHRFATGGQGTSSGRIAIWNLRPVIDPVVESDENVPKCLCQLDHANSVNCVRWSHSGKSLASGGDDKLIMIWTRVGEPRVNGFGMPTALEQYRCAHTLMGHESDVLDVAWDPHDTRLASCSVDNSVIVWNMDGKPTLLVKLLGHTGLVKGVAWDPVGAYLASQSDDRTLRIWRTSDWKEDVAITKPFVDCGDITHVLRLDWSPDGQNIVSAHATNSGGPTAQIIERASEGKPWGVDYDFVGHRKAVTCVRFFHNLLTQPGSNKMFCLLATGGRDSSIVVWATHTQRPVVALRNSFTRAVVDLSWSTDARIMMACSWDGSVRFFVFTEGYLGNVVTAEARQTALENLYGKQVVHGKVDPIVEFPELLDVPQEKEQPAVVEPPVVTSPEVVTPRPIVLARQIEVKRADGKRRITPIMLPAGSEKSEVKFASSSDKTTIVVEQMTEKEAEEVASKRSASNHVAETPPKRRRMGLVCGEVELTPVVTTTPRPKFDPRPAGVQLRALGMTGAVRIAMTGTLDVIVIESQKDPPMCKIRRESRPDGVVWENILAHSVVAAKSNSAVTVCLCTDRSVNVLDSNSGAPLRLPFLLPGPAACVDLTTKNLLCVVTSCGYVLVWDLLLNRQTMRDSTLKAELLLNPNAFSICRLRENGLPLVVFNNGRSFAYSAEMGWQLLTDIKTPLWQLGGKRELYTGADMPFKSLVREVKAISGGPQSSVRSNSVQSATTIQCSTALLYQQMHAADGLGSHAEFKAALLSLIKQLAQTDAVPRIRELLNTLATPRGLLPDCLNVIKGFLNCQRLYSELSRADNIEEVSLGPPSMD